MSKRMQMVSGVAGVMLSLAGLAHGQATPAAQPSVPVAQPVAQAAAPKATLNVGDKAPALTIEKFVKGDPVTGFEKGKVYVVEFWATWCGPCRASMPHLSKLQSEYKDKGVTIIGVTSEDPRNSLADVEKMANSKTKEKTDTMGYTVAWDKGRETNKAFMEAAMQNGIPTSFVIDQTGTLAWVGHPMKLDEVLKDVVAGTWDMAKAKAEFKKDLLSAEAEMVPSNIKKALRKGDAAGATALAKQGLEGPLADEPEFLNGIAWTIVDPGNKFDLAKNTELLDLAVKAAAKASTLTKDAEPGILDTYATALFAKGDKAKAIEIQTKAVAIAKDIKGPSDEQRAEMVKELSERLDQFKNAK